MRHNKTRSNLLLIVLLIAGGWLGNWLGVLAATFAPMLGKAVAPFSIDIEFLKLAVQLNPLGLLGIIVAIFVWTRI